MENFSDNKEKRKLGRPQTFDRTAVDFLDPDGSVRQKNNAHYLFRVINVLKGALDGDGRCSPDHEFYWLFETVNGRWKRKTLLVELGRLWDPKVIHNFAAALCEMKPSVVDGVGRLRNVRLRGRAMKPGSVEALANNLQKCLNDYLAHHEMSDEEVTEAVERLYG